MKKLTGTLFLICIVLSANAQLLWKISGKGLEKPSYLIGTHHLAPLNILENISGYQAAFDATDQVIGELIMADMASQEGIKTMMSTVSMQGDTTLQMLFTPEEFERLNAFTKENMQLDLSLANKLKPAFIATSIVSILHMKNVGNFNPNEQLDSHFQKIGAEKGKKIASLETIGFQSDMLFNKIPLQRQAESLMCTMDNMEKAVDETKRLIASFMEQDIQALYDQTVKKEGTKCDMLPYEWDNLVVSRNKAWVEVLPAMMKEEPAFIAVGALHLPGPDGVINLLKNKGYTVEPVQ